MEIILFDPSPRFYVRIMENPGYFVYNYPAGGQHPMVKAFRSLILSREK